jgi:signal transduction histidine kinase
MSQRATLHAERPAGRRLARPATAWTSLIVILAMFVTFGIVFYTPLTPPALFRASGALSAAFVFPFASFAIVGAVIAMRRPANPVGWLCMGGAAVLTVGSLSALVGSVLFDAHNALGGYILLLSAFWNAPGGNVAVLFIIMLLLFPNGNLPSPRWRWVIWAVLGLGLSGLVLCVVNPTPGGIGIVSTPQPGIRQPVSILAITGAAPLVNTLSNLWNLLSNVLEAVVIVSIFVRLRGADSDTRHQIKWVAASALLLTVVILLVSFLPNSVFGDPGPLVGTSVALVVSLAVLGVPFAICVAVLKYRLYDIDILIGRTLVYGALAIFIGAVYVGIAVGVGLAIGGGGKPNLALSILATAIVALGFQPVRERVQRVANRLVYGQRATPYEVLSQFSEQVAESYDSNEVLPRMARVLAEGTDAAHAEVWLGSGEGMRRAASFPLDTAGVDAVGVADVSRHDADRSVPVGHHGEVLGALSVTKRRGESLSPNEIKLMDDLAQQAGLVLKNVGLTADLQARLLELRASRQRLVAAQDDERRRLERNLHDGAQQYLVAIKVKVGVAEMLVARDPQKAATTIGQLKDEADEALETLRDLARGIYPPLLADKGLVVALESQARKATLPVSVEAEGVERYAQDVEATVYFCVLEALQNVQKYANATRVVIRIDGSAGRLRFEVIDDGVGFDTVSVKRGAGLTNMVDRVEALDGSVDVTSVPGAGTRVHGGLPTPVRDAVLA